MRNFFSALRDGIAKVLTHEPVITRFVVAGTALLVAFGVDVPQDTVADFVVKGFGVLTSVAAMIGARARVVPTEKIQETAEAGYSIDELV